MRILFLGDIVGKPGVAFVRRALPVIVSRHGVDLVIANAENATDGSGLTGKDYRQLHQSGVDLVTLGDHVYRRKDIITTLEEDSAFAGPPTFLPASPGRDSRFATLPDGTIVAAFSLLGRTYMRPADCPYRAADRLLTELAGRARCIFVDMHAEATADKYLMGHHLAAASLPCLVRTPTFRRRTSRSCPAARRSSAMSA